MFCGLLLSLGLVNRRHHRLNRANRQVNSFLPRRGRILRALLNNLQRVDHLPLDVGPVFEKFAALNSPYSVWLQYDEFDSAAQCKREQAEREIMGAREHAKKNLSAEARAVAFRNESVECIASDDPRLAK